MANLVITSSTNSIKVDFGTYSSDAQLAKGAWAKASIKGVVLAEGDAYIRVDIGDGDTWNVVFSASDSNLIVDSVDGTAPTSNADLYAKLIALIA